MGRKRAGGLPFGIGETKPRHFLEMMRIVAENASHPRYAWRVLNEGVCDGCALGTAGMRDWTIDGTHLCLVRLNLLKLNTMDAMDASLLGDVAALNTLSSKALRDLGRLPYPMRRRAGEPGFTRVSWEEANAAIAARMREADPRRMACYLTSRGITNEVYYTFQKAWRALGSPHIDNSARLCHSPSTAAMKKTLGVAASTCSYKDWFDADLVIFFGSNPANDQPVAVKYLLEAQKQGTRVFSVNTFDEPGMRRYWVPSDVDSALFGSKLVERNFPVHTGGDLAFLCAVQKRLISTGRINQGFIDAHTEDFDALTAMLEGLELDDLIDRSGSTREDVEAFADLVGGAEKAVFVWSMGITQHAHGTDTVAAICNLGLMRGYLGRDGCGLMPIRGHSGVQGGAEMGAYATVLPGGVSVADDAGRARFESLWGFEIPEGPGYHTVEMLEVALDGGLDLFWSVGGNFLETVPQPDRARAAMQKVAVRVHQDIVVTRQMLIDPAEEVWLLPARTRYEQEGGGTETTTERRVILSPHIPGHDVGEARSEWRIILDVVRQARPDRADRLDFPDGASIRQDIADAIPHYAEIAGLSKGGDNFQYGGRHLCPDAACPLPGGRARFAPAAPPDRRLAEDEFWLATRRGKQFNAMVQKQRDQLTGFHRDDVLMADADLERFGLADGQAVRVWSPHGEVRGVARRAQVRAGNVQMHWPEANPLLPHSRLDPGGRVPDYNAAVRIAPVD